MTDKTVKRGRGRPRHYNSPEEFDAKVDEYMQHCKDNKEPVTWTGMALYMGFAGRICIDEYAKYDGYSYSVRRAKSLVEWNYEMRLSGNSPTGSIFALKNMGWHDKQVTETTSTNTNVNMNSDVSKEDIDNFIGKF